MWQRMLKQDYVSKNCDGRYGRTSKCCKGCDQLYSCKFACEKFADQIAKHKAEAKVQKKTEREEQKAKEAVHISEVTASWARFSEARAAAKMTTQFFLKQVYAQDKDRSYMRLLPTGGPRWSRVPRFTSGTRTALLGGYSGTPAMM